MHYMQIYGASGSNLRADYLPAAGIFIAGDRRLNNFQSRSSQAPRGAI